MKTFEELEEELCKFCRCSEYGLQDYHGEFILTPNGAISCEGNWCDEAYKNYLQECEE